MENTTQEIEYKWIENEGEEPKPHKLIVEVINKKDDGTDRRTPLKGTWLEFDDIGYPYWKAWVWLNFPNNYWVDWRSNDQSEEAEERRVHALLSIVGKWEFYDEDEQLIPHTREGINQLPSDVLESMAEKLVKVVFAFRGLLKGNEEKSANTSDEAISQVPAQNSDQQSEEETETTKKQKKQSQHRGRLLDYNQQKSSTYGRHQRQMKLVQQIFTKPQK